MKPYPQSAIPFLLLLALPLTLAAGLPFWVDSAARNNPRDPKGSIAVSTPSPLNTITVSPTISPTFTFSPTFSSTPTATLISTPCPGAPAQALWKNGLNGTWFGSPALLGGFGAAYTVAATDNITGDTQALQMGAAPAPSPTNIGFLSLGLLKMPLASIPRAMCNSTSGWSMSQ